MMMTISNILPVVALVVGYWLGSIPFAVFIAKKFGVDILKEGSGNPGATNVKRCCGKKAGNTVFFLDMGKGFVSAFWPFVVAKILLAAGTVSPAELSAQSISIAQLCGFVGAVLGHCFSIFLKFKGGKGVSTTIGALLGAMPLAVVVAIFVWLIMFFATKIVAIASIVFGLSLPIVTMIYAKLAEKGVPAFAGYSKIEIGFCLILALFIIVMHHANIRRIFNGTENTFKHPENSDKK